MNLHPKHLVTRFAFEKVHNYKGANELLQRLIDYHNQNRRHAGHRLNFQSGVAKCAIGRPHKLPPRPEEKMLNLDLALHLSRRVSSANTVEFLGRAWKIPSPNTKPASSSITRKTLLGHRNRQSSSGLA